ncbi:MAG TPA: C_GCAxxG_C_C family protein [Dehalococcoidia bacterium]|nr:C_GCAxxG_C_C family protein [Dehalococcoidia bacterium]
MWEAEDLGSEDVLWASTAFNGGIAGQQDAPCGTVSSCTVCLGLRHRKPPNDIKQANQAREDARKEAGEFIKKFRDKFGSITCRGLLGFDFSNQEEARKFRESEIWREKCDVYVKYVIEYLYKLADSQA